MALRSLPLTAEPNSNTPHTTSQFFVSLGYIRPIFDYVRNQGEDLNSYLKVLNLRESDLSNVDLRVAAAGIDQLLALAANRLEKPHIGLQIAQTTQLQNLGTLGLLIMNCRYAHEIFELHNRYQTLVGNPLYTQYYVADNQAFLETRPVRGHSSFSRHSYDYIFGGWWHIKRALVGDHYSPDEIQLPYPEPEDTSALEEFFAVSLSFNHPYLRVRFSPDFWNIELTPADAEIKNFLEAIARRRLHQLQLLQTDENFELARIKAFMADRIALKLPSIDDIAEHMELSSRTLQRQLEEQNTNYRALLEEVRIDLAKKHIDNDEFSLLDVAMMLGFSEQSAFQRAFKRWFGCTPGTYRRVNATGV